MTTEELRERVENALAQLPTESGGMAIALATAGSPPAIALLSSGDVYVSGEIARVGIYGSSSAVSRLGGAFTLLVPLGDIAVRVEAVSATATEAPPLAMIEGRIAAVRPTAEPPWTLEMGFTPEPANHPSIPDFLNYWSQVKAWLAGEQSSPPQIPG